MRTLRAIVLLSLGLVAPLSGAIGQPVGSMLDACSAVGRTYFRDGLARTDMRYDGQRVDGTHAVNGQIVLETRAEPFSCSFGPNGRRMVEFFAEGRLRNAYLPGGGAAQPSNAPGAAGTGIVEVTGVSGNDVLNVRAGPGTQYRKTGALSSGTPVRNLGCQGVGNARWCQIEMLTDMRERGWVNGRYLTAGTATQLPSPPNSAGSGDPSTVRVKFAPGTAGATLAGSLAPGDSRRYVLGARNGQFLDVRFADHGANVSYQIFNPDRTFLLDQVPAGQTYRGQLWQSGDHVIEVINRSNRTRSYTVVFHVR